MESTRCKFVCTCVEMYPNGYHKVILSAQYDDSLTEDQSFSKASPSGDLSIMVSNPAAHDMFEPGKAYYIDIAPVAVPVVDAPVAVPAVEVPADAAPDAPDAPDAPEVPVDTAAPETAPDAPVDAETAAPTDDAGETPAQGDQ